MIHQADGGREEEWAGPQQGHARLSLLRQPSICVTTKPFTSARPLNEAGCSSGLRPLQGPK
ncbi:hypothetical protein EYF80_047617 [Liparis tanakae]|uniref:Uncharacterized protein n=1 Tax=Liparis tanakae TaxID=230148 RepID=A0A4Z2FMH5_9TELE|nr:hypothetical protein EYF80_047617 [Liparis tanakae]